MTRSSLDCFTAGAPDQALVCMLCYQCLCSMVANAIRPGLAWLCHSHTVAVQDVLSFSSFLYSVLIYPVSLW